MFLIYILYIRYVFQSVCRRRMEAGTLQSSGGSNGRGCNFRAEIIFPYQSFDLLGVVSLAYVPFHLQLLQLLQFLHRAQRLRHPILRVIVESLIFLVKSGIMFRQGFGVSRFFWITMKLYVRNILNDFFLNKSRVYVISSYSKIMCDISS